ncbi:hypothetical protein JVT61DRAFT_3052 [Boletus reticuloceps]|uniref:Uncharacterized protein n=1 Tax=Boletus reticuloceps TaxID=495285 RepID=A0A8I2YR31_9AGAM|nr:hypothetical protein JVT61DRAFT_3052 [Boletus reticuloceps]
MDSILAIGVGLVLRIVVDVATDNDDRVGGVLVGLWEGVVLNHFIQRMPRSFDPYLGFGFRIFVDFLFTQSLSRLSLIVLWALVGMLLADIAPNIWRDSGLRHLYRQVRKDVRHVKRSVPRIRIKNDFPSVHLFNRSRSTSSNASSSIRSDRAIPSRSPAPSPTPGHARRSGPSPPGTFPDVSGWSETNTEVSDLRERVVTNPGPSPALIPSREHVAYEHIDTTHAATSQTRTTIIQDTTITIRQTQNESVRLETSANTTTFGATAASTSIESVDDPSRHNPPAIPDDWVDIDHPTPAKPNEPVAPLQTDPDPTPTQPGPSTPTQSRPASILDPPPPIHILPDIPDVDHGDRASRLPDQIPLPSSRAASVIGGVYDQPEPRSALRDNLRSRVDKAASEIGVNPAKPLASIVETQSTKSQSTTRSWTSWVRPGPKQSVEVTVPEPPPKETQGEPVGQSKPDAGSAVQGSEPKIPTPAQVDPSSSILTQPGDPSPLLLSLNRNHSSNKNNPKSVHLDADKKAGGEASRTSPLDLLTPSGSPPPPFTEFAGVPEGLAAGEGPVGQDPATQDEAPTELTQEQKAAEEKRIAFLMIQVQELEGSRVKLEKTLDKEDDPAGSPANAIVSDLEDEAKMISSIKARIAKKKFSEPPLNPPINEIFLTHKSVAEAQYTITSAILDELLARDDAGPMTIQFTINKQKLLKTKPAKETKDAVLAFVKRHRFTAREGATPGIINVTF